MGVYGYPYIQFMDFIPPIFIFKSLSYWKIKPTVSTGNSESCVLRRDDFGMPLRGKRRSVKAKSKPTGSVSCWASKTNFLFQSWHQFTVYLGWAIGLFCVSKSDNTNFVYTWANIYPFTIPVTFILCPARGICERGNCKDWVAKYFAEICSWIRFFKVLLQLSRDISNLRLNHSLNCRFWGCKIQSWTWSGTKLKCSWLFVFIAEISHLFMD